MELSPPLLLIVIPLSLVAGGLLLSAYLAVRRSRVDPMDRALEALATESMDELLLELQRSVEELKIQLTRQRATLAGLLSDDAGYPPVTQLLDATDAGVESSSPGTPAAAMAEIDPRAVASSDVDLRSAVDRLVAEGLSDRAVARRLRIGLEEVRLARQRRGAAR